jgi:hypothetical protein
LAGRGVLIRCLVSRRFHVPNLYLMMLSDLGFKDSLPNRPKILIWGNDDHPFLKACL